jgi:hypothetical protein
MTLGDLPKKVEIATKQLISLVGAAMELAGLDEKNNHVAGLDEEHREYWIGYRDAVVNLISEGTGIPVALVHKELQRKMDDLLMEDTIEELFGDDDGLSGYDC